MRNQGREKKGPGVWGKKEEKRGRRLQGLSSQIKGKERAKRRKKVEKGPAQDVLEGKKKPKNVLKRLQHAAKTFRGIGGKRDEERPPRQSN